MNVLVTLITLLPLAHVFTVTIAVLFWINSIIFILALIRVWSLLLLHRSLGGVKHAYGLVVFVQLFLDELIILEQNGICILSLLIGWLP